MVGGIPQRTKQLYWLLDQLPLHDFQTPRQSLPENGIYVFFEREESVEIDGVVRDRIVRVGTHRGDSRLRRRLRQHYGGIERLGTNKRASVFRRHVGAALMRRKDPQDPRLSDWLRSKSRGAHEVEVWVSKVLRESFTFRCVRVDSAAARLSLESGLIALLAQHPIGEPTPEWLGHHAAAGAIRLSGLWNTQHVSGEPLTDQQLERLSKLVPATMSGRRYPHE
jgi:hypothetical protein